MMGRNDLSGPSADLMVISLLQCNVIYGWNLSSYKTFMDALMTLIGLQIGIFNYDEVRMIVSGFAHIKSTFFFFCHFQFGQLVSKW